jgi:hypothetical protein
MLAFAGALAFHAPIVDADITTPVYSQISANKNTILFHADLDQHKGSGY